MSDELNKGMRFNSGKLRYDLIPQFALKQFAKVLSMGAEKYAPRNWESGMKWSIPLASLKRHLAAFEMGEDYDKESGLLHIAHIISNAAFIAEYYNIYPQGDDRPHTYLKLPKIGLDVDEVLADWVTHWCDREGIARPKNWHFTRKLSEKTKELQGDKDFWLSIPPKINPDKLHFEPHCYITSRPIPNEWTEEWLDKNGFAAVPVYTIQPGESKVEIAKREGVEIFVDDSMDNFIDLNNAGICCYLMDAAHNRRYDVGHKRLYNIADLFKKI